MSLCAKLRVIGALLLTFCLTGALPALNTSSFPAEAKEHPAISGDLVFALAHVAQVFDVSLVAETAQPYPANVRLPGGIHTAQELLNLLVQQCPGYRWQEKGSVAWVYNEDVLHSSGDFLNRRIDRIKMPVSLADLHIQLPVEVSVAEGRGRGVTAGVAPREQQEFHLAPETLTGVSIRDVLLRAGTEVRLFCLVVFPNSNPTESDEDEAFSNWYLVPIKLLDSKPLGVRSAPAKHNFGPRQ